jgi:CHAT domain-containing protein
MVRLICLSSLLIATSASLQEITLLEPNKPIEKALAGGQAHSYRAAIGQGQVLRVIADQLGVDVTIKILSPDGKLLADVNLIADTKDKEIAVWAAEAAGEYRIELSASEKSGRGRYHLTLEAPRAATEQDHSRVAAQQNFMEAERLFDPSKPAALRQSLVKYEAALPLWRSAGDPRLEALTLYNIGDLHQRLNEPAKAVEPLSQAIRIYRDNNDLSAVAASLNLLGIVYRNLGDRQRALEHLNQALPLRRAAGDRTGEAVTLNTIATIHGELGERRKALDSYHQILPIRREVKDRTGEATTLNNIGSTYLGLGEKRKAIKFFNDALQLARATNNRPLQAIVLTSLGNAHSDLGDQQKALENYTQALPLRADPRGRAVTLMNFGRAYDLLGASQEALNYFNQALQLARSVNERRGEAQILNFTGLAYWSLSDYQKALDHFNQALPIRRETKDRAGEAATLNNIGLAYDSLGDRPKALDAYNQALALLREVGDRQSEAKTLNNIGFLYDALGDKPKALDHHERALKLARDVGDRMREAKIRYGIARIESQRNRLRQARNRIEETIKIVESLRAKLTSPELRASYRASTQQYYDLYIDVLMRMGRRLPKSNLTAEAFQVGERARARSLIELLTEAGADIRQGVDPDLVERERELQEQINDKSAEQIQSLGDKKKADQTAALAAEIEGLTAELRNIQTQIRQKSPRYASLTQPQPLTVREIQQRLLDANTMLLEYWLGEERSYLWAVTKNSLRSFTLPKRDEIESKARRFYELITARNQYYPNESNQRKQTRIANADAEGREVSIELSRILLGSVAAQLGNKRLIIVADGALQYTPFAALPRPVGASRPLIVQNEITGLPSASTLAVLRREMANRPAASKTIAVIADPVFEADDERVNPANKSDAKQAEPGVSASDPSRILLKKSAKDSGATDAQFRIPRLPNTRREAETILALASSGSSRSALDFSANRTAATSEELGQYRIVHFATHGFLNSLNPEISGLVLTLVDEKGAPQNGFLLAPEVYNLKLPSTDLVVLSACQTGLGKEVRGEGVIGMTRGFMYAGAPRVLVSLWNISDRATADLMKHFYQGLLGKRVRPAAALRAAQIELLKQKQWQASYYWAAFGLQGEWR